MKNGMNAIDIEKTTFFGCVFVLFLFFLSSRAYIIDKHLSLIDIIPILYILQPQCLSYVLMSYWMMPLKSCVKVIKSILLQLVSFNKLVVFVNLCQTEGVIAALQYILYISNRHNPAHNSGIQWHACPVSSKITLRLSQTSVYTELSRKCSEFDTLNSPEYTELLHHISLLPQICNNFVFLDSVTGTS